MRVVLIISLLAVAKAFMTAPAFGRQNTEISAEMTMGDVRKAIESVNKDNMSETLSKVESYLTSEAGATFYAKSMRRLAIKAKVLGTSLPDGFAKDAKATQKRREKQDAFCKAKVEVPAEASEETSSEWCATSH